MILLLFGNAGVVVPPVISVGGDVSLTDAPAGGVSLTDAGAGSVTVEDSL